MYTGQIVKLETGELGTIENVWYDSCYFTVNTDGCAYGIPYDMKEAKKLQWF